MRALFTLLACSAAAFTVACGPVRDAQLDDHVGEDDAKAIVGGTQTSPGEYGHQVSVQSRSGFHFCGGSLIDDRWVLTAAHCVAGSSSSSMQVELGVHRLSQGGAVSLVDQVIVHPSYNGGTNNNDIALLRLSSNAANFPQVTLVDSASEPSVAGVGTFATVTGWGALSSNGGSPDVLMEVDVPILSNGQCDDAYRFENITGGMLCAGYLGQGGRDACQGDSGGPLVVPNGGEWALAGVVSWGYGCADPRYPGVYARVSWYEGWINQYVPGVQWVSDGGVDPDPGPGPGPDPVPSDDHGDSTGDATVVDVGGTGSASIDGVLDSGDIDMFRLEVAVDGDIVLQTRGGTDTYGTLFDGSGNAIGQSDDDGANLNFRIGASVQAGTYYLQVRGYSSQTTGAYDLELDFEASGATPPPPPPVGDDHGDDAASATVVVMDVTAADQQATAAATLDAGDRDVFRIEVVNNSNVGDPVLLSASTLGNTDTYGTLFDASGNVVDQNDDANVQQTGYNFGLAAEVQPGVYFLEVRGYSTSTSGPYDLTITAQL